MPILTLHAGIWPVQALCMLSQNCWAHMKSCPALCRRDCLLVVIPHLWFLDSFSPLPFCSDPWAVQVYVCMRGYVWVCVYVYVCIYVCVWVCACTPYVCYFGKPPTKLDPILWLSECLLSHWQYSAPSCHCDFPACRSQASLFQCVPPWIAECLEPLGTQQASSTLWHLPMSNSEKSYHL